MRTNPFTDSWLFLIGQTPDHEALGSAKYLLVLDGRARVLRAGPRRRVPGTGCALAASADGPDQPRAVTMVVQALSSFAMSRCGAMRMASLRSSPRTTGQ